MYIIKNMYNDNLTRFEFSSDYIIYQVYEYIYIYI